MAGAWGFGATVLARFGAPARRDAWLEGAIATTLGVGLFIVALQALAIAGALRQGAVLALLGAGIVLALLKYQASQQYMTNSAHAEVHEAHNFYEHRAKTM